ncbi:uncharacterized protein LOC142802193 isoform X2 [Rhipicephalus microplus]|uniref:uncharacterized protein LOC142802193 isoform X2 n=1 Tax=Rhipicephalus microplus TaxID=6941 RepID=UPI003F6B97A6
MEAVGLLRNGGIPGHVVNLAASAPWCFHGIFTDVLALCRLILSRKRGAAAAPRKEQAPSKLPKLSSTETARSLCGIENHCKECLISTLCCSFIAEDEVDHSRGTSRCVLCL